jgi:hypothetical protein
MQDGRPEHDSRQLKSAEWLDINLSLCNNRFEGAVASDAPPPTPLSSPSSKRCCIRYEHHTPFFPRPETPVSVVGRRHVSRADSARHGSARLSQALGVQKVSRKPERKDLSPATFAAKLSDALAAFVGCGATSEPSKRSEEPNAGSFRDSQRSEQLLVPAMEACSLSTPGVSFGSDLSLEHTDTLQLSGHEEQR